MAPSDALSAKLESLKDATDRIETAAQRVDDNVDMTRHALRGEIQKLSINAGLVYDLCRSLVQDTTEIKRVAGIISTIATQASGGSVVFRFLWPILVALAASVVTGLGVYVKIKAP